MKILFREILSQDFIQSTAVGSRANSLTEQPCRYRFLPVPARLVRCLNSLYKSADTYIKPCDKISLNKIFMILSLYFSLLYGLQFHRIFNSDWQFIPNLPIIYRCYIFGGKLPIPILCMILPILRIREHRGRYIYQSSSINNFFGFLTFFNTSKIQGKQTPPPKKFRAHV